MLFRPATVPSRMSQAPKWHVEYAMNLEEYYIVVDIVSSNNGDIKAAKKRAAELDKLLKERFEEAPEEEGEVRFPTLIICL